MDYDGFLIFTSSAEEMICDRVYHQRKRGKFFHKYLQQVLCHIFLNDMYS